MFADAPPNFIWILVFALPQYLDLRRPCPRTSPEIVPSIPLRWYISFLNFTVAISARLFVRSSFVGCIKIHLPRGAGWHMTRLLHDRQSRFEKLPYTFPPLWFAKCTLFLPVGQTICRFFKLALKPRFFSLVVSVAGRGMTGPRKADPTEEACSMFCAVL